MNTPAYTLATLLAAAAAVLVGGTLLARRDVVERTEIGRDELGSFAGTLSGELRRLEALYEDHLLALAEKLEPSSEISLRAESRYLKGLAQISIVPREGKGTHAGYRGYVGIPVPVFDGNDSETSGTRELLSISPEGKQGWLGSSFYLQRDDLGGYVVLATDTQAVSLAVRNWIAGRYAQDFEPVAATGALVQIDGPGAFVLEANTSRPPDFVLPLPTRFGRWKISAWDEVIESTTYHKPTLVAGSALALAFMIVGGLSYLHLGRLHKISEQRVSFVNRVSHEMRTPLTNILLNTDLALQSASPTTGWRLSLVSEECGRLSRLIANVLTFSQGKTYLPKLRSTPLDLAGLTATAIAPFQPALARRNIVSEIDIEPQATALADPDACAQILGEPHF